MARRRQSVSTTPPDVVRHSPVEFTDDYDLPEVPEGVSSPRRVPLLSHSQPFPLLLRRPGVNLSRSVARVWDSMSQAKPTLRRAKATLLRVAARRLPPPVPAKQGSGQARSNRLFNVLSVPFSRRTRMCVQRKTRKEVLFALRRKGVVNRRSPGRGGTYRRTQSSQWRCA